jgi:hypothetical protein
MVLGYTLLIWYVYLSKNIITEYVHFGREKRKVPITMDNSKTINSLVKSINWLDDSRQLEVPTLPSSTLSNTCFVV